MKVTITEAADALGVSRKHVSAIINGRAPVTPDMAMRLAVVFATEAELWVNMQAQYDLWVVSQKAPPKVKPLRKAASVASEVNAMAAKRKVNQSGRQAVA